jgi:single-stranded-DNA-specific exonuclease
MKEKRWNLLPVDELKVSAIQQSLKVSKVICTLLVQRGMETFEQSRRFFRPQLSDLHNPWLMKDMRKAVDRLLQAFSKKEKVLVFGDYDVDGTTAVACMYQFIQKIYDPFLIDFYIPHRYREGYGISKAGIDFAKENGFTLVVALDCGIKSIDLIGYAKSMGIDFIVCDHHLPDASLPPAVAILNPKQKDCNYPYKELSGCGVGLKLIGALVDELNLDSSFLYEYLDLVATSIAADIVDIVEENRVLAYYGLKKVNENPNFGIQALKQLSNVQKQIQINELVFMIAPRINAAGRMDDARKAVLLFIEQDYQQVMKYASMLHSDNSYRKEADSNTTEEALALIESDQTQVNRTTSVVYQPHWHKGVVGIVASRLINTYYRPTVVLTKSGDVLAGSARSVPGFNLYEAVHACRDYLLGYGGHFAAAGMTLLPEQLDNFSKKFEEVVSSTITPSLLTPEIIIDTELMFSECTPSFYKILSQMEPFGPQNLRPVFVARNVVDNGWSKIVKEQHIKFSLQQGHTVISGIGFGLAPKFGWLQSKQPIDVVFTLHENEWQGTTSLQLRVLDISPAGTK